MPEVEPILGREAFTCPHCDAFAQQDASDLWAQDDDGAMEEISGNLTICRVCHESAVWWQRALIYPVKQAGPPAPDDLPESVRATYTEARAVVHLSPRSAAALLRLVLEGVLEHLYPENGSDTLNNQIGKARKAGLPQEVIDAMDVLRFGGNEAVHNLHHEDTPDTVQSLFRLVNIVVTRLITEPRQIAEMHRALPSKIADGIAARDAKYPITDEQE